eukprot:TRINITY_DN956_c8_g1_i1.p1 TRINITY_DN956_c8_g1~~TRINITY_DN956_c8_g1_i1.p1  ORF type:complete len:1070 (+),score=221.39 TRINITY_DN956_c8_g1_i1:111-3320(+)
MWRLLITVFAIAVSSSAEPVEDYYFVAEDSVKLGMACTSLLPGRADWDWAQDYCKNQTSCHAVQETISLATYEPMTCPSLATRITTADANSRIHYKIWTGTYCTDNTVAEVTQSVEKLTTATANRKVEPSVYGSSRCVKETDDSTAVIIHVDSLDPSIQDVIDCSSDNSSAISGDCAVMRELSFEFSSFIVCGSNTTKTDIASNLQTELGTMDVQASSFDYDMCPGLMTYLVTVPQVNESAMNSCLMSNCPNYNITMCPDVMNDYRICVPQEPMWATTDPVFQSELQFRGFFGILNIETQVGNTPGSCRPGYTLVLLSMYTTLWDEVGPNMNVFPMPPLTAELVETRVCADTLPPNDAAAAAAAVTAAGSSLAGFLNLTNEVVFTTDTASPVMNCSATQTEVIAKVTPEWKAAIDLCVLNPSTQGCTSFPSNLTRGVPDTVVKFCSARNGDTPADVAADAKTDLTSFLSGAGNFSFVVGDPENCTSNYVSVWATLYPEDAAFIEKCIADSTLPECSSFPTDLDQLTNRSFCAVSGTDIDTLRDDLSMFLQDEVNISASSGSLPDCPSPNIAFDTLVLNAYWKLITTCVSAAPDHQSCSNFPQSMRVGKEPVKVCVGDGVTLPANDTVIPTLTQALANYYGNGTSAATFELVGVNGCPANTMGVAVTNLPLEISQNLTTCLTDTTSCASFPSVVSPPSVAPTGSKEFVCLSKSISSAEASKGLATFFVSSGNPSADPMITPSQNNTLKCSNESELVEVNVAPADRDLFLACLKDGSAMGCSTFPSYFEEAIVPQPETPTPPDAFLLCITVPDINNVDQSNQVIVTAEDGLLTAVREALGNDQIMMDISRATVSDCGPSEVTVQVTVSPPETAAFIEACLADRNGTGCDKIPSNIAIRNTTPEPPTPEPLTSLPLCVPLGNSTEDVLIPLILKELAAFLKVDESEITIEKSSAPTLSCPAGAFEISAGVTATQRSVIATCYTNPADSSCEGFPASLAGPAAEDSDDGFPLYIIIIIAAGIVVVIGAAGFIYWRRTHRPQFNMSFGDQCDALDEMECEKDLEQSGTHYSGLI